MPKSLSPVSIYKKNVIFFFQTGSDNELLPKNVFPNEIGPVLVNDEVVAMVGERGVAAQEERMAIPTLPDRRVEEEKIVAPPKPKKKYKVPRPADRGPLQDQMVDSPDDVRWEVFGEKEYVDKKRVRPGEDNYAKNKFNQLASDNTKSNREVPDTRHQL